MRITKILAGTALVAMSTVSAHALVMPDSTMSLCVGKGATAFERSLSEHECLVKQNQAKANTWNSQAAIRNRKIAALQQQIKTAPLEQKPHLEAELQKLQGGYHNQYQSIQSEQNARNQNAQKLKEQYDNLPVAEKARLQRRMNQQMVQQKLQSSQKLENTSLGRHVQKLRDDKEAVDNLKDTVKDTKDSVKSLFKGW